MRKLFFLIMIPVMLFNADCLAQDTSKTTQPAQLLSLYFDIKDALVAGNASAAASKAGGFVKVAEGIGEEIISAAIINPLVKNADKIAGSKDIKKQRDYFSEFSTNMTALVKSVKLGTRPVYLAYCPMKKASWLSSEKAIKNPYYGNSMLTCGEVTETIQ